jgi:hypothetical protein
VPGHPLRRAGLLLLLTIAAWGLAAAHASAASVVANGNDPDAVVDRDGITHVVWNESRPGAGDILHYCQIPRGATACTDPEQFIPPSTDQALNIDFEGPHVMVTPFGEVILLTHRCCAPIMGQSSVNVVYVSDDGGLTFGPAATLSSIPSGEASVPTPPVFDGAGRNVVTMSAPTEGIHVQGAPLAQGGAPQPYTGGPGAQLTSYSAYNPSIVQRDPTSFVAAWADLNGTSYIRTVTCPATPCTPGAINNGANWTPQVAIPEAEYPRLTTGPSGTFLMYRGTAGDADNKYFLRRIDGTTVGPALALSDGNGGNMRDIVQDAGGILHALYTDKDSGLGYRASANGGTSWGDQQTLVPGPDYTINHVRVTARTVDAGFTGSALWESNDNGTQNPPILVAPLPDPSVSLQVKPPPGGGGGTGTPPPSAPPVPPAACRLLTFAAVDVIADACLTRQGDVYIATGGVRINGLRLELGSGKLRFDIKKRTITSSGAKVTVKVGDTVLFKDDVDWTLPKGSIAALGTIDVSGGGDLLGFPLEGKADLKLRGGGAEIPVHLGLPALFGGVTGDVTIRADNVAGVHLRELHVKVGDAFIGPLEIKDLFFDYDAENVSWAGGANVILPPQPPGPSLESKIGFSHGDLDYLSAELTLPGPGVALDPFAVTYLKKIRFSLKTEPLRLSGGITVNAGPEFAGVAAISVDGDLTFTLGDPAILRIDGTAKLVSIPLATAFFELRTNGYVGFGGHLGYEFSGFSASADVSGWLFKSQFNVQAGASICLGDLGCAGGDVVFSSTGFAGCAKTFVADFGAGYKWGESLDLMWSGCDVGPYRAVAAAAQAGGTRTVTFAHGLPSGFIGVQGQGGPPHVSLVGPGGRRIDAPATGKLQTDSALAFHVPETNTTYFALKRPAPGTWTIEPAADSTPITGVKSANGLDEPKVTGSVRRTKPASSTRTLSYNVTPLPGQQVTFAEQGKAAVQILGRARGGRGTLRFTPADGRGGRRKVIGLVSSYGKPRTQITVATYVAPAPPRPARVTRLRARRSGTRLAVTWARAANAKRYEIRATLTDGRRLRIRQAAARLTIPAVARATRATITVTGLKADLTRGKAATVKVAAQKKAIRKKSRK